MERSEIRDQHPRIALRFMRATITIHQTKLRRPCFLAGAGAPVNPHRIPFPLETQGRAERRAFSQAHGPMRNVSKRMRLSSPRTAEKNPAFRARCL
jgi:hypothetical protein